MNLLSLYLRREPTTDDVLRRMAPKAKRFDVVAYKSAECVTPCARWPWHYTKSKPTRRNKRVMFNCYQWATVWLPDAV